MNATDNTAGKTLPEELRAPPVDDMRLPEALVVAVPDQIVPVPGGGNGISGARQISAQFDPVTEGGSKVSIQNLLWGAKWGGTTMGQPVALTYSLANAASSYDYSDDSDSGGSRLPITAGQATAVTAVLAAYSAVARLTFTAMTDSATQAGDLRYGNTDSPLVGTAYAYGPWGTSDSSDVWFGDVAAYQNPLAGSYGYATFLHETGHAMGLMHPHEGTVAPAAGEDQLKYSVMSYRSYDGASVSDPYTNTFFPTSLMINDIQALQFLYGANADYHSGADTYSWSSTQVVFETLWDGGGTDTLSAAGQAQSAVLYLTPGKWSQIGVGFFDGQANVRDTLTIAYGAVIENAVGSDFADTLEGNAAANSLTGGQGVDSLSGLDGNDTLDGGDGADVLLPGTGADVVNGGAAADTLVLAGNLATYTVTYATLDSLRLTAGANVVIVRDVESFQFADVSRTLAQVQALVVSIPTSGADVLLGDGGANSIDGLGGNDTILGNGGADTLIGGSGVDSLVGGPGDDVYAIDVAGDQVVEDPAAGHELVRVGLTVAASVYTLPVNVEDAEISSSAAVHLVGNVEDNLLTGNTAANSLTGNGGDDTLDGGAGNDTLAGGDGNDTYRLNVVTDVVTETGTVDSAWDGVELSLAAAGSYTLPAGVEWLAVTHTAALGVNVTGNGLDNWIDGGSAADTLRGGVGDDVLAGHDGADVLDGGDGIDTADYWSAAAAVSANLTTGLAGGAAGADTLTGVENLHGSTFNDTLTGDGGANLLRGDAGNDTLAGQAGSDTLEAGPGNDVVDGGADVDWLQFANAAGPVSVDLATGRSTGEGTDTLSGIEGVIGSAFNDTLVGDGNANRFEPGAGDDSIGGSGGIDLLSYDAASAAVTVNLAGGTSSGGSGNDSFSGIEAVLGSIFDDSVSGQTGADSLAGNDGNDTLRGAAGADTLDGGIGSDLLDGGTEIDLVDFASLPAGVVALLADGSATSGSDTDTLTGIENAVGTAFADTLRGTTGSNVLDGAAGNDLVDGGQGDDTLAGGAGNDTLDGGLGQDTASFAAQAQGVVASLAAGTAASGGETDTLQNLEHLLGSSLADTLTGNGDANRINGGSGSDSLVGNDGNDTLVGDVGNDTADGGIGTDLLVLAGLRSAWTVTRPNATDVLLTKADGTAVTMRAVENVQFSDGTVSIALLLGNTPTAFGDTLEGTAGPESIDGLAGNDSIQGLGGNDTLVGGAGIDTLLGGTGDDLYRIDVLTDLVQEDSNAGVDRVEVGLATAGSYTLPANVEEGQVAGTLAVHLVGNDLANLLLGNTAANSLSGAGGNDTLDGGSGNDTLTGGAGDDTFVIDVTTDLVREDTANGGSGRDTVVLRLAAAGSYALTTDVEDARVDPAATVNVRIIGNALANVLQGGIGNDTLEGGAGANQLLGGAGNDSLVGGADIDVASYASAGSGVSVDLGTGRASGDGLDTLTGIEAVIGSPQADSLTGQAGNNTLTGLDGNDTLNGGGGDDQLEPGAGNDVVDGGDGTADLLVFGTAAAVLVDLASGTASGEGSDTIAGIENFRSGAGNDTLRGDGNDNLLMPGTGNDVVDGRGGFDTVDYGDAASAVTFNGVSGVTGGGAGADTLAGIEQIRGSALGDTLAGGTGPDRFDGRDGADSLDGAAGADTLTGGLGNDTLAGGAGNDRLDAGAGSNRIDGGADTDLASFANAGSAVNASLLSGLATHGADTDTLVGIEQLEGSSGADSLSGNDGDNTIDGAGGSDLLAGGNGIDTASFATLGTSVNATLLSAVSGPATDTLSGFENLTGSAFNDTLGGDTGANRLTGGAGNDSLSGSDGNDTLVADAGNDTADGGTGADTVGLTGNRVDWTLTRPNATDTVFTHSAGQVVVTRGIETVAFSDQTVALGTLLGNTPSPGDDTLEGTAGPESIDGLGGNDSISGLGGNDTLVGGAGIDTLLGGPGDDQYSVDVAGDQVQEDAGQGTDLVLVGYTLAGTYVLPANVEHASVTSALAIHVTGNGLGNRLVGNAVGNSLVGSGGNDTLDGGAGNDTLDGGDGDDTYVINVATDVLREDTTSAAQGYDTVQLAWTAAGTYALPAGVDAAQVTTATALAIRVTGNALANQLTGGIGNETLEGGSGADVLAGGLGNDVLDGGLDIDTLSYAGATGAVVVNLATGRTTGADGLDTLTGIENVTGSALADSITGNASANLLFGNGGSDTVDGSGGNDTLQSSLASESLLGGDGIDWYDGQAVAAAQNVDLGGGSATGAGTDTLSGIENARTGSGNDTLSGDTNANVLAPGLGNDLVSGGDGIDTLDLAGASAGVLVNTGTGRTSGGAGNDTFSGIEQVLGSDLADTLAGSALADIFNGRNGNNSIDGAGGADLLSAGDGNDTIVGGAGNDTLDGGRGNNRLDGGADVDRVSYAFLTSGGGVNASLLAGQATRGADTDILLNVENLLGSPQADTLAGDAADNAIDGGAGADVLAGNGGQDTAVFESATAPVNVSLVTGLANASGVVDTLSGFAHVDGGSFNDTLVGDGAANRLRGAAGNDSLGGGAGNDTLVADLGNDTVDGGADSDTLSLPFALADYVLTRPNATDFVFTRGALQVVTARGIESVAFSDGTRTLAQLLSTTPSAFDDALVGTAAGETIDGLAGNDSISGLGGDDLLIGGAGIDTLAGGPGNDTYRVDVPQDVLAEDSAAGIDRVEVAFGVAGSYTLPANVEHATVTAGAAIAVGLVGNALANELTGNAAANSLAGNEGSDTLDGGAGIDTLAGGDGDDVFVLRDAGDQVVELPAQGTDTVRVLPTGAGGFQMGANVEVGRIVGSIGVTLTGNAGSNTMQGDAGNDTLAGGDSADVLSGGAGNDLLRGEGGDDTLLLPVGEGNDTADGGDGTADRANLSQTRASFTVTRPNATDTVLTSPTQVVTLRGVEFVQFSDVTLDLNTLWVNSASIFNDTLLGTPANDALDGLAGNDSITGEGGDDTLTGGPGVDTLDGGAGNDVFRVDVAADVVVEAPGNGIDRVDVGFAAAGTYVLPANVDNATVTAAATVAVSLTGNDLPNLLVGNAAANLLQGAGGDDTLIGGDGNDTLAGGTGNDQYTVNVVTDVVNETAAGSDGTDTVFVALAASGTYTLPLGIERAEVQSAAAVVVNVNGNALPNVLIGHAGNSILSAGDGDDTVTGGGGIDTVDGGVGSNDLLLLPGIQGDYAITRPQATQTRFAGPAGTVLASNVEWVQFGAGAPVTLASLIATLGSPGADTLVGGTGADSLAGDAGNDSVVGADGDDTLEGGSGNDTLVGGSGTDLMNGGDGSDTYAFERGHGLDLVEQNDTAAGVVDTLALGAGIADDDLSFSRGYFGFDDLVVHVTGVEGDELLVVVGFFQGDGVAPGTVDQLRLVSGQVFTQAQLAAAALAFDGGDHVFVGYGSNDSITGDVAAAGTADWVLAGGGSDTVAGLDGNDTLFGEAGNDSLSGGGGADHLAGGAGNDTLSGGAGADRLSGGNGSDRYLFGIGSGSDVIVETLTAADWGSALDSGVGPRYAVGSGDLPAGGDLDVLVLDAGVTPANLLATREGDALVLRISGTSDRVEVRDYFANGVGTIERVQFANGVVWTDASLRARVLVPTSGSDTLTGYLGGDNLSGLAGNDVLDGRDGNDTLAGGEGADTLTGGSGADRFVFGSGALGAVDTITDFVPGVDRIVLSRAVFTAFAATPVGSQLDPDTNANVDYNPATGALSYDADGAGAGAPVTIALLGVATHPASLGADVMIGS